MVPEDIVLIHPALYDLRAMVVTIYNRAVAAGDADQKAALKLAVAQMYSFGAIIKTTYDPGKTLTAAQTAHFPRDFTDTLRRCVYRATRSAEGAPDIRTDIISLFTVINAAA